MDRLSGKVHALVSMLRAGNAAVIFSELRRWLHSDSIYYGLCRDLTQPFVTPVAKIPLTVRPLEQGDISKLLNIDEAGITGEGAYERINRLNLMKANIGTCYVAVTTDNSPCYMQWLMGSSENDKIQVYFKGIFPILAMDEALLEDAFTHETYRGQGIMPCAMSQIAEKATALGARRVITFVDRLGTPSLKGCKRAGFTPYLLRTDQWRIFRRRFVFTRLPTGTPYPFDVEEAANKSLRGGFAQD